MLMQDELLNRIKELQVLLSDAKIQLPDMEMVLDSVENMNKAEALTKHPYSIWQGKDGNWHTYFPDEHGRRIPRKRKTRDSLEKLIVSYWKEQADNPTVRDVFTEWIENKIATKEIARPTYDRYWVDFERYFSSFGSRKIKNVTPIDVEDFLKNAIAEFDLTAKAYSNLRTLIYGIFKRAKKRNLITYSITEVVKDIEISRNTFKHVIKEDYQEVFMEDEEVEIKEYLNQNPDIYNLAILLLFATGLRIGELVAIKNTDIEDNVIHIRRTETRYNDENGKAVFEVKDMPKTTAGIRDVIIPKGYMWVVKKIRILNPFGEYFLMKNGERVRTYAIRRRMQYICKKLNIYSRSPHKIRKTYGSILLDNDVDSTLIINQMGHTDILCTEKHYHRNRKDKERKAYILDHIPEFVAK